MVKSTSALSDISIELPHYYIHQVDERPDLIKTALLTAKEMVMPLIDLVEKSGGTFSTVAMIDDYFLRDEAKDKAKMIADTYRDVCEEISLPCHHIVYESACANTADKLLAFISEAPRPGAGSRGGIKDQLNPARDWLSNGDALRLTYKTDEARMGRQWLAQETEQIAPKHNHSIFLDIQLFDTSSAGKRYACPTLAAWWQLIRLGVDKDENGDFHSPAHTESTNDAPPLFAKRTLTFLPPDLIEVEHAVSCIIRNLSIPPRLTKHLKNKRVKMHLDNKPVADRIAYVIMDPDFLEGFTFDQC